ncbi:MAG: EAL domain-containing protein [Eubacteriales bacterium]|jgi:PAS domain S-box-containing protein|nr:EAL domain-containing protein [Eubacteriales bacterium]
MEYGILAALINNAALLLALSVIHELAFFLPARYGRLRPVLSGLLIAAVCGAVMAVPFVLQSGIVYDTRSILISVAALIFGPVPALITVAAASVFRIIIGGPGIWAGLATIIASALIGLAWRRWVFPGFKGWQWVNVLAMGICVHLVVLACQLLLPSPDNLRIIAAIALPMMLVYPAATVMLSLLLLRLKASRQAQAQLAQSEARFKLLFEQAPLGYQSLDINGNLVAVNQQWCDLLGYSQGDAIGKWFGDFLPPEGREAFGHRFPLFKQRGQIRTEFEMLHRDGRRLCIAFEGRIGYGPDGAFKQTHCILQDVTSQKAAEEALNESERSKSVLLANLQGMAYRCNFDRDWTMQFVSSGCQALTGYQPEDLIGNQRVSFNDLISPEFREIVWDKWSHALAERKPFRLEYAIITARGERKWVLEIGQGVYNDRGGVEALEGIIVDITDRKEADDHLIYLSEHDKATGLYNRESLETVLIQDAQAGKGEKRALISVNLSMVQLLAANYGLQYTQNLISEAARALNAYSAENRILFITFENHFAFYVKNYKDTGELAAFGESLAEALEALFVTDRIIGGIGIHEISPEDTGAAADVLLRRLLIASERSIAASHKNFGITFYNQELEDIVNREGAVRHALSSAERNEPGHELFVVYQPIMDIRTGAAVSLEALARLRAPDLGLVSPLEFIPIAEKTKLIIPLGESVFRQAFDFIRRLGEHGHGDISVSVNVSLIQLLKPDFARELAEMMARMSISPTSLGIEITESIFASDYAAVNRAVQALREAGIRISIDDFGTGYSSLARQREMQYDCLKIDKYFVDQLMGADPGSSMVGEIIAMAHNRGHCVVAEGVEHQQQLDLLRELGCDRIQGFLIANALNEEEALGFLNRNGGHGSHPGDAGSGVQDG